MMRNDNLQPLANHLRLVIERRAKHPSKRPPTRKTFWRMAKYQRPELAQDYDDLYYDCHWWWVLAKWKINLHWYHVSAEKMLAIGKAYSADTFPRLRDAITHDNKHWFITSCISFGDIHPPLCEARMLLPGDYPIEPGPDDYYTGKTVSSRGVDYKVSSRKVMFFSESRLDGNQQEDLFA